MKEIWIPIKGFEDRYAVSNCGRVKSVAFRQRYILRTGFPAWRVTKERILAQQKINSGYLIVHLHLDKRRSACTVHRLVAAAYCSGYKVGAEVNHLDGCKEHNCAANLEWTVRTSNHLHAVHLGLNTQAIRVKDPVTGAQYDSISQAARATHKSHRTVRATFKRVE